MSDDSEANADDWNKYIHRVIPTQHRKKLTIDSIDNDLRSITLNLETHKLYTLNIKYTN